MPEHVNLIVIGRGSLEEELKELAVKLGVSHRVRFLGFKSGIYDYLAHVDGLLMPSLHEGLPYTLLEAMSLGRPVLASDVGGLGEVIEHGSTACSSPANDRVIAEAAAIFSPIPTSAPRSAHGRPRTSARGSPSTRWSTVISGSTKHR